MALALTAASLCPYPLDMNSAYRFIDEFKLHKSGIQSQEINSIHIAFVQGNAANEPEYFENILAVETWLHQE